MYATGNINAVTENVTGAFWKVILPATSGSYLEQCDHRLCGPDQAVCLQMRLQRAERLPGNGGTLKFSGDFFFHT